MNRHTISKKRFLEVAQVFHWARKAHFQLIFTGRLGRHSRTEKLLPRLVREKRLRAVPYERGLVYAVPRRTKSAKASSFAKIEHGLACTDCLVRVWRSKPEGEMISEKFFTRKFVVVPEWGIRYPNGKLLLFEYSSRDNFTRYRLVEKKVERYRTSFAAIAEAFSASEAVLLFVMDVERMKVKQFVMEHDLPAEIFFTDYDTFKRVELGKHLFAPIYFWRDGKEYPLSHV